MGPETSSAMCAANVWPLECESVETDSSSMTRNCRPASTSVTGSTPDGVASASRGDASVALSWGVAPGRSKLGVVWAPPASAAIVSSTCGSWPAQAARVTATSAIAALRDMVFMIVSYHPDYVSERRWRADSPP